MANCPTACAVDLEEMTLASCTPVTAPGGIRAIGVMKCDADFSDVSGGSISDVSTWESLVASGDIVFSGQVIGSKAAGSDTNLRIASCLPEIRTGRTTTISIRDYNVDATNHTEYDFYSFIDQNFAALKFFYVTCDERVYFYDNGVWAASVDDVRPETKEEPMHIAATITVTETSMKAPVVVAGITDILP